MLPQKKMIEIGQKYPTKNVDLLIPKLTRQNIREVLVQEAKNRSENQLALKRSEEGCTLSIDAGSLSARHFIDFVISSKITAPFLYKAVEKNFATIEDYKKITAQILDDLIVQKHLKIVAIVTDNLYVQVAAIAHWHPDSLLSNSTNPEIKKIFFFSCLCHTTDLIVSCTEKNCADLSRMTKLLNDMVTMCRIQKIQTYLGARCPEMVITRWLSKIESINFILGNKKKLIDAKTHNDEIGLTATQVAKYMSLFTDANFDTILDLGHLIYPFHVLIKEFEKEKSRQYKAVPYFNHLEEHLQSLAKKPGFEKYSTIIVELQRQLNYRKRKTLHWELLLAAYSLTYQGRIWLRRKIHAKNSTSIAISDEEKKFTEKLPDMAYQPPAKFQNGKEQGDKYTEALIEGLEGSVQVQDFHDLKEIEIHDHEVIPPTHDQGLFMNIVETLKEAAEKIGESPDDIESVFNDYIYMRINEKFEPIAMTFPELNWNKYVLIPKMKSIVNVATRLLLAKASEACVERYFSKQKLILNYLRLQSKEDLLNARFQLKE